MQRKTRETEEWCYLKDVCLENLGLHHIMISKINILTALASNAVTEESALRNSKSNRAETLVPGTMGAAVGLPFDSEAALE